ncbi:solute carrier family 46 member 2-like isoform X2 [Rhinoraja longicauda]
MCGRLSSFVEIAVALHQVAGAFFDTTLLMVTQERCNSTAAGSQGKRQACISRFYLYNNLLLGITPLVFTFTLARLGDEKSRKITICVPLVGYLVSRSLLLWLILFQLPLEAMLATALLNGLSGGFTSFWTGVMALASDTSSVEGRSARLIRIEMTLGLAGMIGSVASGHIFVHFTLSHYQGAVLAASSCCLYALCLLYCTLLLRVPPLQTARAALESDRLLGQDHVAAVQQNGAEDGSQSEGAGLLGQAAALQQNGAGDGSQSEGAGLLGQAAAQQQNGAGDGSQSEGAGLLGQAGQDHVAEATAAQQQNGAEDGSQSERAGLLEGTAMGQDGRRGCTPLSNITIALLFAGGVLYDLSVAGGVDVLPMFVLKAPLQWDAIWVGYGNAAGYTIFLTSFLGVKVLSRYLKDTSLIVIGMVSFSSGMMIMAYVKWTSFFFIARAVMMFALIPLPMIRSVISKQISNTSYAL